MIKSVEDPNIIRSINNNPIIKEPVAEGIVKCYVIDLGDKFEFISKSHLTQFGLDINEVDDVAIRNIKNKFYAHNNIKEVDLSDDIPNAKPFYKVEMDANFPPSMMLVDDFWDNVHQYIQTETVAVSLPSKSLFFFSDFQNTDSFQPMKTFGEYMYNVSVQDNIPITQNIYLRVNGKWTLFSADSE